MEEEIRKVCEKINSQREKENIEFNDRPCELCGGKKFINLFRNVVGEINGEFHGYYSLLGGSLSGYINGYTKTIPVLSCKKCNNEREINTWKYESARDFFWGEMYSFYFGIDYNNPEIFQHIQKGFLNRPLETRQYMIDNPNWNYDFYNRMPDWETKIWLKAGFSIKPIEKKFLWWKWKVIPTWKELENESKKSKAK